MDHASATSNVVRLDDHRPTLVADIKLPASFLKGILLWACNDETRFHMSGVHFSGRDIVATDGHRLVKATVIPLVKSTSIDAAYGIERGIRNYTIPRKPLESAVRAAGNGGTVEIRLSTVKGKWADRVHGVLVATRKKTRGNPTPGETMIPWEADGGTFPAYDQVVPSHVSLMMCDPTAKKGPKKGGEAMQTDDYLTACDIVAHGVNPRYLGDMADVIEGFEGNGQVPAVLVHAARPLDPIVYEAIVRPNLPDGPTLDPALITFVIMPMRVGGK